MSELYISLAGIFLSFISLGFPFYIMVRNTQSNIVETMRMVSQEQRELIRIISSLEKSITELHGFLYRNEMTHKDIYQKVENLEKSMEKINHG